MSKGKPIDLIRKAIQTDSWSDCLIWLYDLEPKIIKLQAENKSLKRHLNILAELVILREPELWEIYLEETKEE